MRARRAAPEAADWPADTLPTPDYADAFQVAIAAGQQHDAATWMRSALEDAPTWLRWFVRFGWRWVLGFRPARTGDAILGWPVTAETGDWVLLEQRSPLLRAALLLRREPAALVWGTRVCHQSPVAPPVWALVGLLHRRIVPFVLTRAAQVRR